MDLSKANRIIPTLRPGITPEALVGVVSSDDLTLLSSVDGRRSIAALVEHTGIEIKPLLLQLKTLAKEGHISLKKQAPTSSLSAQRSPMSPRQGPKVPVAAKGPKLPGGPKLPKVPGQANAPRQPLTPPPASASGGISAKGPKVPKMPKMPKRPGGPRVPRTPPTDPGTAPRAAPTTEGGFRAVVHESAPSTTPLPGSQRPKGRRTTSVPKPEVLKTKQAPPTRPPTSQQARAAASPPPAQNTHTGHGFAQMSSQLTEALADVGGVAAGAAPEPAPLRPVEAHGSLYEALEEAQSTQAQIESRIAGRPSAKPLSEEAQELHEIIKALARVTVTFQLYDASNDAVRDALGNLQDRLLNALRTRDALFFPITAYAFFYQGEMIYFNDDRENSLAFKLFRDGIRGIQFTRGLDWEELGELLRILGMRYNGVHLFEDDIVTLFWKSNLKYIEVIAVEGFEHSIDETEGENPFSSLLSRFAKSKPKAAKKAMPTRDIEEKKVSAAFKGMQGALLSAAIREENGVLLAQQLTSGPINYRELSERVLRPLHAENDPSHISTHVHSLMRYVERHALDLIRATELKGLFHLLEQYHGHLIADGNMDALLALYQECERWDTLAGVRSKLLGGIATTLMGSLTKPAILERLIRTIDISKSGGELTTATKEVLSWKSRNLSETLFGLLEDAEKPDATREVLRHMLVHVVGNNPEAYVKHLGLLSVDYTIQMIRCLHMLGTSKAIEVLASQISHYDPKVRGVIFEMAEEVFQGSEWVAALRDAVTHMLNSKEPDERKKGYDLIQKHGDRLWAPLLFKKMEAADLDLDELKRVACMAASLHPRGAQSQMIKLAEPPRLLSLESSRRKMQRYAALIALGEINTAEAEGAIKRVLDKGNTEYKDICVEALRNQRRGGNPEFKRKDPKKAEEAVEKAVAAEKAANVPNVVNDTQDGEGTMSIQVDVSQLQSQMMRSLKHVDNDAGNEFNAQIRELGQQFVQIFHMLQKTAVLYDADNLIFRRPLREITLVTERLIDLLMGISVVAVEEQFYINDIRVRLQGESAFQIGTELFGEFQRLDLGGFTIATPLTEQEWRSFVHILAGTAMDKARHWKQLKQQLADAGLGQHVDLFGPVVYRVEQDEVAATKALPEVYSRGVEAVEHLWQAAVRCQAPSPLPMRRVINNMVDILNGKGEQVFELLALEDPDEPLKIHLLHVAIHAMRIGKALGLSRVQLADLGLTAYFHDIGHVALTNPDDRRQSDWSSMNHQQAGFALLLKYRGFHEAKIKRLLCTLEHHKDATPKRASQQPILYSRIVRVADVYETITSNMMGDTPISPARAITLIAGETKAKFDPVVTQAFVNLMGRYPFGSLLELEDGALCISLGPNGTAEEFTRPRVLLTRTPDGDEVVGPIMKLASPQHKDVEISRVHEHHDAINPKRHLVKYLMRRTDVRTLMEQEES